MYICMYVCMYACMNARIMYASMHAHMHARTYECTYVFRHMYIRMYVCMNVGICTYVYMYVSMYVCMYVCMYVYSMYILYNKNYYLQVQFLLVGANTVNTCFLQCNTRKPSTNITMINVSRRCFSPALFTLFLLFFGVFHRRSQNALDVFNDRLRP